MAARKLQSLYFPIWGSFIIVVFTVLYFAQALFIPIFLAILTTFLLNPVVAFIARRLFIPRPIGAALLIVAIFLGVIFTGDSLTEPATMWFKRLPVELKQTEMKLSFLKESIKNVKETTNKFGKIATVEESPKENKAVVVQGPNLFNRIMDSTQSFLVGMISYIVLLYFLLTFTTALARDAGKLLKNRKHHLAIIKIAREAQSRISYYLLVITVINIVLGCLITLGAWATGLPNPLVWGFTGALLNYIPYLGPAINIGIVSLVSLLSFNTMPHIVLPPLLLLGLNILEGQVVQPLTVGKVFTINPVVVFLSIVLWGWLWGIAGVFMAVPILMTITITFEQTQRLRQENEEIAPKEASSPAVVKPSG